jgi:2-dehydro-3-deoxyphosphooctonate aldolase (KDO 8-P synthase)
MTQFLWSLDRLTIVAGPCSLEDSGLHDEIAAELESIQAHHGRVEVVFKGSFDKANRTSGGADRGIGMSRGISALGQLLGRLPVMTDFHQPEQAGLIGAVVDILQVPAALCRQTDMIRAAARTGRAVNLKKGQWVSVFEMEGAVDKWLAAATLMISPPHRTRLAVTERGSFFGYGDVVADFRNIPRLKSLMPGVAVLFDATHTVQRPGAGEYESGGEPEFIPNLARAGVAAGADGIFIETHPDPKRATSDGNCMLPLKELGSLVRTLVAVWDAVPQWVPSFFFGDMESR